MLKYGIDDLRSMFIPAHARSNHQNQEDGLAEMSPFDPLPSFDNSSASNGLPSTWLSDQCLPSLAINQPLSALWTLSNVDEEFDAFAQL